GDGGGFGLGHLYLRVGPIPTMWISYPVTCYRSTTVRRLIAASPPETPPATRGAGSGQMRHGRGCPSLCCRSRPPDGQAAWPARILACSFQPLDCEIPLFYPPCLRPYRGPEGVKKPVLRSATDAMRGAV